MQNDRPVLILSIFAVLIIRYRSKMERDQWAFALDNEIERLVRQKRATE